MNALARFGRWLRGHPQSVLAISVVLTGIVLGASLQYALFMAFVIGVEGLAILIPFTLLLGAVALVFLLTGRPIGIPIRYTLLAGVASILSLGCLLETGSLINKWKIAAVGAYVSRAVPILDRIKAETQAYPATLPVDIVGEPPSLLRDDGTYTATKDTFCFEYVNEPGGWAGGEGPLKFESSTRKWVADR